MKLALCRGRSGAFSIWECQRESEPGIIWSRVSGWGGGRCRGWPRHQTGFITSFFHSNSVKLGPGIRASMSTCQLNTMPALLELGSDTSTLCKLKWSERVQSGPWLTFSNVTSEMEWLVTVVVTDHSSLFTSLVTRWRPSGCLYSPRRWVTLTWWSQHTMTDPTSALHYNTTTEKSVHNWFQLIQNFDGTSWFLILHGLDTHLMSGVSSKMIGSNRRFKYMQLERVTKWPKKETLNTMCQFYSVTLTLHSLSENKGFLNLKVRILTFSAWQWLSGSRDVYAPCL